VPALKGKGTEKKKFHLGEGKKKHGEEKSKQGKNSL